MQSSTRTPHEEIAKDPYLEAMHANAEVFDLQTERLFRYLQVNFVLAPLWLLRIQHHDFRRLCNAMHKENLVLPVSIHLHV